MSNKEHNTGILTICLYFLFLAVLTTFLTNLITYSRKPQTTVYEAVNSQIESVKALDDKKVVEEIKKVAEQPKSDLLAKCGNSSVKTYMDYRTITSKTSKQYRYIQKHIKIKDGFLYNGEYMAVALGSAWGKIGSKYIIKLDNDKVLKVVKVDEKADIHTVNGCQQKWDKSVIEFIVDKKTSKVWVGSNGYLANGNFNNLTQFKGKITSIIKQV